MRLPLALITVGFIGVGASASAARLPVVAAPAPAAAQGGPQPATQPSPPQPPATPPPIAQPTRGEQPRPATPPAQPAPPAEAPPPQDVQPSRAPGSNVNVRIDATVIEHRGDQVVGRKTVSATVVDGQRGSVRSTVVVQVPTVNEPSRKEAHSGVLNMDVQAWLLEGNRVRVSLTLEARGGSIDLGEAGSAADAGIRQSVTVVLEPGKPLVVAQSADAVGNRRLALEVRATVLR
jgi:hypothetical protein